MGDFFFKPSQAYAGDFIPFYDGGYYYLFYLKDYRNPEDCGEGTPWFLTRTSDFVHFEDLGEAIPRGRADEQDLFIFTGSVVKGPDRYHIFYTGHNHHLPPAGGMMEGVMHAVSDDLTAWRKTGEAPMFPPDGYGRDDWRDPFAFFSNGDGLFHMLLAARRTGGASRRRGVTAHMTSPDLARWTLLKPFWAPGLYYTHECPDYFVMGDWEYLIFSEFSDESCTRYVMRRLGEATWRQPADDRFDGRALYAAKTASDGKRRFLFGWVPTRADHRDEGEFQWGGCLNVHELIQRADGTLAAKEPEAYAAAFAREVAYAPTEVEGVAGMGEGGTLDGRGGAAIARMGALPQACRIELTLSWTEEVRSLGVMLRADAQLENGHELRIEPQARVMLSDRWPRPGDQAFEKGLIRPLRNQVAAPDARHRLALIADGSALCAWLDGDVALSLRAYGQPGSHWGLYARGGAVTVHSTSVRAL